LSQKTLFLGQKVWKVRKQGFPNVRKFWKFVEIVLFRNFQKLRKNDVKLELQKSRKTRSYMKTHSKVCLKVRNAGPYFIVAFVRNISSTVLGFVKFYASLDST